MKNKHLRLLSLVMYASVIGSLIAPAPSAAQIAPSPSPTGSASPSPSPEPNDDPLLPVYRFYSPTQGNAHFFTMDETERNNLLRFDNYDTGGNWKEEGIGYWAHASRLGSCGETRPAIYRYRSDRFQTHFYTANQAEMHFFTANSDEQAILRTDSNWRPEGISTYVY